MQWKFIIFILILASCNTITEKKDLISSDSILNSKKNTNSNNNYKTVIEPNIIDTFFIGDMNSDKITDTAFIYTAPMYKAISTRDKTDFYYEDCVNDSCCVKIKFSCNLPNIYHCSAFEGIVINVDDLDGNGVSEIMYVPDWFTSCWQGIFIYSHRNKKWHLIGRGSVYRCAEGGVGYEKRIIKINNKEFYIVNDEWDSDGLNLIKKKEKIIIK